MNREQFARRLAARPLLLDGAMGTMLHARGAPLGGCFEALNRDQPALVAEVHRAYIDAGADIIETNTFGANRFKLGEFGLDQLVRELNEEAVAIARRVILGAFRPVLLAGSIGPLGVRLAPLGRVQLAQAEAAFAEQIAGLLSGRSASETDAGVDLLILETMSDLLEVEAAVAAARRLAADVPIVVQMTFTRDDRTLLGARPGDVASKLAALDLDAIGINCSGGPAQAQRLLAAMAEAAPGVALAVSPNAGWPEQTEGGRMLYPATPAYFADYARLFLDAGAGLVGGCCGTTPAHTEAMRAALDEPPVLPRNEPRVGVRVREPLALPPERPTRLAEMLARGRFIVTVEMSPPRGLATERLLTGARMLREAGADFIDVADSPLARMRMSAWAAAHLVQREVGLEAILHFPTRGRNLLRIHGDLLAAHALGVRNLFVVMGDPTRIGDYPEAADNYDIVPTGLIALIKGQLNQGVDKAGQSIDGPTGFVVGCALSLNPADPEREMQLLHKKIRSGADFALTQPVFDAHQAIGFLDGYRRTYGDLIPIIAGIKPLFNSKNAAFLHHEVPGIRIPAPYRDRMASAEDAQREGVAIAREILMTLRTHVQGAYLMPAFGRYDLAADVIDVVAQNRVP
jgi:homocysteine S-methyltransferase